MGYNKPPLDLDARTIVKSRIKLVGIELEGGWKKLPKGVQWVGDRPPQPGQLGRDGSLDPFRDRLDPTAIPYVGEHPSLPMPESALEEWFPAVWPDEVGKECGMHVHISLETPFQYMRLMDDEAYPATVVEYIRRWAVAEKIPKTDPLWGRLEGTNIYCQHVFAPDDQVKNVQKDYIKDRKGHRYTAINFCYGRETGTVECRLFSMPSSAAQGLRAAREFISVTNRFLLATSKREKKIIAAVKAASEPQVIKISSTI